MEGQTRGEVPLVMEERHVGKSHSLWKEEANAEVDADDTILVARD